MPPPEVIASPCWREIHVDASPEAVFGASPSRARSPAGSSARARSAARQTGWPGRAGPCCTRPATMP